MVKSVNGIFGSMLLGAVALAFPTSVSADQIALTFEVQGFTLTGEFLEFAEDNYIVITENGAVHVPAAMVSCEGNDCAASLSIAAAES